MNEIEQIKKDIEEIKKRNDRVEKDKAWEISLFRKALITILTYVVIVLFFFFAELPKPFVNAIVPTLGFILSTLSVSFIKNIWIKNKK
jgi:preprotein translocase subunit SecF